MTNCKCIYITLILYTTYIYYFRESVRLGEHQLSTDVDCRYLLGRFRCAPPVEDFGVEKVYIHPQFSIVGYNDIALVKLSSEVEFKSECNIIYEIFINNYIINMYYNFLQNILDPSVCL